MRKLLYPFDKYRCKSPIFHKEQRRHYVYFYDTELKKNIGSTSYARYLMSIKLGRELDKNEEVDHLDGDCTSDNYDNLEVVSRDENLNRYHKNISVNMIEFTCPNCLKRVSRRKRRNIDGMVQFCSKHCSHMSYKISDREELIKLNNTIIIEGNHNYKVPEKMELEDFDSVTLPNDIKPKEYKLCKNCSKPITNGNSVHCSTECSDLDKAKTTFPIEELYNRVKEIGFEATGREHNISGNAIKKRLRVAGYDVKELSASRVFTPYTIPCGIEGCNGLVTIRYGSDIGTKKFCSKKCVGQHNKFLSSLR